MKWLIFRCCRKQQLILHFLLSVNSMKEFLKKTVHRCNSACKIEVGITKSNIIRNFFGQKIYHAEWQPLIQCWWRKAHLKYRCRSQKWDRRWRPRCRWSIQTWWASLDSLFQSLTLKARPLQPFWNLTFRIRLQKSLWILKTGMSSYMLNQEN